MAKYIYQVAYSYYDDYSEDYAYATEAEAQERVAELKARAQEENEQYRKDNPNDEWAQRREPDDHYEAYRIVLIKRGEEDKYEKCTSCATRKPKDQFVIVRDKKRGHTIDACMICANNMVMTRPDVWSHVESEEDE